MTTDERSSFKEMAISKKVSDRIYCANTTTDKVLLKQLAEDPNPKVRAGVARNQNTSKSVLTNLSTDQDDVVWFIANHALREKELKKKRRRK